MTGFDRADLEHCTRQASTDSHLRDYWAAEAEYIRENGSPLRDRHATHLTAADYAKRCDGAGNYIGPAN